MALVRLDRHWTHHTLLFKPRITANDTLFTLQRISDFHGLKFESRRVLLVGHKFRCSFVGFGSFQASRSGKRRATEEDGLQCREQDCEQDVRSRRPLRRGGHRGLHRGDEQSTAMLPHRIVLEIMQVLHNTPPDFRSMTASFLRKPNVVSSIALLLFRENLFSSWSIAETGVAGRSSSWTLPWTT